MVHIGALTDDQRARAWNLGGDFSESENGGKPGIRLYSGRDVAAALGITDELEGEDYVALLGAYEAGRSDYW